MSDAAHRSLSWRKSSFSGEAGCVEVAFANNHDVLVRDSKNPFPDSIHLSLKSEQWALLLADIRRGRLDL